MSRVQGNAEEKGRQHECRRGLPDECLHKQTTGVSHAILGSLSATDDTTTTKKLLRKIKLLEQKFLATLRWIPPIARVTPRAAEMSEFIDYASDDSSDNEPDIQPSEEALEYNKHQVRAWVGKATGLMV